ncbi:hypothetical protein L873DRAFT_1793638 [Choiromyces venosus 120613-1]|uniref:Uncharacterized protein n=1 Tax=Choiromyces venosus 120613-1 TaxID=1336337 RepID=A0A3N4JHT2_9PEZI|nr:hypothetical protein L873DRAFT_1793638 [Choiromyces venosus 120613-1]
MQIFFLQRWAHFRTEWQQGLLEPLVDQSEEFANICSPIPGSFKGYLFFFAFGTTAESRLQIQKIVQHCCCFLASRKSPTSKQDKGKGRASASTELFSKRTIGTRSISYPTPGSNSLLSPEDSNRSNKPSPAFSPREKRSPLSPISVLSPLPRATVPPSSNRTVDGNGFQFGIEKDIGSPSIYSPLSAASSPALPVPLGKLMV